jgi:hypothetical protein
LKLLLLLLLLLLLPLLPLLPLLLLLQATRSATYVAHQAIEILACPPLSPLYSGVTKLSLVTVGLTLAVVVAEMAPQNQPARVAKAPAIAALMSSPQTVPRAASLGLLQRMHGR